MTPATFSYIQNNAYGKTLFPNNAYRRGIPKHWCVHTGNVLNVFIVKNETELKNQCIFVTDCMIVEINE